jgi:hypothetical protein
MRSNLKSFAGKVCLNSRRDAHGRTQVRAQIGALALLALVCGGACGCLGPESKHATALAAATAPVVDQAEAAYKDANAIHDLREDYDAAVAFDKTDPVYNPRDIKPLLSEKDMDVRLAVLKALQLYVKDLVAVTNGTESKELDDASTAMGSSLAGLGNAFLPAGTSSPQTETVTTNGVSVTQTTTTATNAISTAQQNQMSAAVNALGQFLVSRKVKKELPGLVEKMDPQIETMCKTMASDIDALKSEELIDFNFMINQQTLFLRENKSMDVVARRALIMKLPEIVRKQRAADDQLDDLKSGLGKLYLTHHAFAAALQGNNPSSISSTLSDLSATGGNLGKYYSSLPAK